MAISIQEPTGQSKIVQRAIRGDSEAFSTLFDQYFNAIYRYLVSLSGDEDTADDLAQETFIRAYRNLHRLGPPYAIRPWLYRIAHNVFITHVKGRKQAVSLDPDLPIASDDPSPEHQVLSSEWGGPVGSALKRLAPTHREALMLREIEGFQYNDIAEILGVSLDNVKVVLHRARASFKDHYGLRMLAEDPLPDCDALGDLLDSFIDGETPTTEQDKLLREHLKTCDTCQQRKRRIAAIALLLRGLDLPHPRAELKARILRSAQRPAFRWSTALNMVLAGIFVGIFGAAVLNIVQSGGGDNANPPSGASFQDGDETDTPVPVSTQTPSGYVAPPPGMTATGDITTEVQAVWDCTYLGGDQFQWVEAQVTYQNGVPISVETLSGPYSGVWQPGCPPGETSSSSDDGGSGGGSSSGGHGGACTGTCGDSRCEATCGENNSNCPGDCP
jgi:RNA polymerase sigma-70 factor, ECF subfamily